jgi:hypothetical protein
MLTTWVRGGAMSDYRATPEQWEQVQAWSEDRDVSVGCDAACILELRARIEALEARNKPEFMELSITTATVPAPKSSDGDSLVRRVQHAIYVEYARSKSAGQPEARAAIREVATWLEEEFGPQIDWITTELREEASNE